MPADSGNQQVSIKYYDPVDSLESNERFRGIRPTGVYTGGYLSKINDTTVTVSPFVCEVQSKITSPYYQVKVETTTGVNVTVSTGAPYVVIRWSYTGVAADDYAEMLGVASPDTRDVILGKCTFAGSVLIGYDNSERLTPQVMNLFLKVEPEETPSMYLRVRAGIVQVGNTDVYIEDQWTSVFVAPGSGSKTGAVYIDDSGAIQVSSDFTWAGQLVLAEIALTQSQTQITAADITDVRAFLTSAVIPDNTTIRRDSTTGKLEQVPHTHNQLHDQAHTHSQLHDEEHTHEIDRAYYAAYNPNAQALELSDYTKIVFHSTVVKSAGITVSSNRLVLSAGKCYKISYVVQFHSVSSSPECKSRWAVDSGDTSWDLENLTFQEIECGVDGADAAYLNQSYSFSIIPNQTTYIQLEVITKDEGGQYGQVEYVSVNVLEEPIGSVT